MFLVGENILFVLIIIYPCGQFRRMNGTFLQRVVNTCFIALGKYRTEGQDMYWEMAGEKKCGYVVKATTYIHYIQPGKAHEQKRAPVTATGCEFDSHSR